MTSTTNSSQSAAAAGTFAIGGDLPVARLGFGTMRLPTGTFTATRRTGSRYCAAPSSWG
jgi:pyridoxine 4-dehydrogenase